MLFDFDEIISLYGFTSFQRLEFGKDERLEFDKDEIIEIQNKIQHEGSTLVKYFLEKILDVISVCLQNGLIVDNGKKFCKFS